MKRIAVTLITTLQLSTGFAQDSLKQPLYNRHETGIILDVYDNDQATDRMNIAGLQYKRWRSENFAVKFIAAYGTYYYDQRHDYARQIINIAGDTFIQKQPQIKADMLVLGTGVEAQRQFYKRVYLFSGVELKAAYGTGYIDTVMHQTFREQQSITTIITGKRSEETASVIHVGITPSIGFKFQFPRITFGADIASNMITFRNISYTGTPNISQTDFDITKTSTRLFFSYKF